MKSQFEIKEKSVIDDILKKAEYGTLALCMDNKPYSVPINYVYIDGVFYFHGSKKGKKMEFMKNNPQGSFSVVEALSLVQSYFRSDEDLACPASHFFKSVSIDGTIGLIEEYDEKVYALQSLMEKYQPEGKYRHLSDNVYKKMINATQIFKLIPDRVRGKIKLGQHLPKEAINRIMEHLEKRGSEIDKLTVKLMLENINI